MTKRTRRKKAAKSRVSYAPYRSKEEYHYAWHLEGLKVKGEVACWAYEPDTFRLAARAKYVPDFRITHTDGRIEYVEVKGATKDGKPRWRTHHHDSASQVRWKVAADKHPEFTWSVAWCVKGEWKRKEYKA